MTAMLNADVFVFQTLVMVNQVVMITQNATHDRQKVLTDDCAHILTLGFEA